MKRYIDIEDMVNVNLSNVLDIIQKNGTVSRKQITQLTGLSWGGMTKIVNKLLEKGYIVETKSVSACAGRTPFNLSVNKEKNFVVGLDINKTGLSAIVTDLTGEVLKNFYSGVKAEKAEDFINEIIDFLSEIFSHFKKGEIISVGVALQGIMDYKNGVSIKFPGIGDWENVPLKAILEERFSVPVFAEHDPDCLLYSFMEYETTENIILFRIDKSIGMAVAVSGRILKGEGLLEVAHTTVIPNGKKCSCGSKGCLQPYISECVSNDGINSEALKELVFPLGLTIKNTASIFNADKVILTGELIKYRKCFEKELFLLLKEHNVTVKIEFCELSDRVLKGAALRAVNKSINSLFV